MTRTPAPPLIAVVFDEDTQRYANLARASGLVERYVEVCRALDCLRAQRITTGDEHDALSAELAEIRSAERGLQHACGGELPADEWPYASRIDLHNGNNNTAGARNSPRDIGR